MYKINEQYGTKSGMERTLLTTGDYSNEVIFKNDINDLVGSQIISKFGLRLKKVSVQINYESYASTLQLRISYGHILIDDNDDLNGNYTYR